MAEKILVVDDDVNICRLLSLYLEREGYTVVTAHNGIKALELYGQDIPDLCILDVMMPGMDGMQLCRNIRAMGGTPVIMLTARGETDDKVSALGAGADDYIVKPFDTKEVVARVKAVLRRYKNTPDKAAAPVISIGGLSVSLTDYSIRLDGSEIAAAPKEIELLYFLMSNCDKVFSRDELLSVVWGYDFTGDSRTVDVHVKRIRSKIGGSDGEWELRTVWGRGYEFSTGQKENPREFIN